MCYPLLFEKKKRKGEDMKKQDVKAISKNAGVSQKISKTEVNDLLNQVSDAIFDRYFEDLSKHERNTLFISLLTHRQHSKVKKHPLYNAAMTFVRPGYKPTLGIK